MSTDDKVAWLGVQLDADEQAAKAATPGPWGISNSEMLGILQLDHFADGSIKYGDDVVEAIGPETDPAAVANAEHIARHDPAAVLADIAAKRAIVDGCAAEIRHADGRIAAGLPANMVCSEFALRTLKLLAAGYRHRDGYEAGWAP